MATFKSKLRDTDARLTSHLCTIPSAIVTQAMAAAGADSVIIDMEHGAVDYGSAHAMIAACAGTGCAPLVRIAANEDWQVKRVLDLGAEGICFPLIRTAEDAARAVASLRYPPNGNRGFGPFIAHSHESVALMDYRAHVDESRVCMLLIETVEAVENIEAICAVPGIDVLVPAFFDLSTAYGVSGQFNHPDVLAAREKIESAAKAAGLPLGGPALTKAQADSLFDAGYRVIAGFDILFLKEKTAETQGWLTD